MKHEDAGRGVLAPVRQGKRLSFRDHNVEPAPALEVPSCFRDVSLRHVDADHRQPRPRLLEKVEKTTGAAADVDKPEATLIASGKNLVKRRQRLSSRRVGRALEQNLHLRVVTLRGLLGHPAAGLEVKILQVVTGPLAAGLIGQHLPILAGLTPAMDFREVLEEKPRAVEQDRPRAIVLRRKRIDASLDIGEVPPEQRRHVCIHAPVGYRGAAAARNVRRFARTPTRFPRQPPHHLAMPDIPGDPRQLPCAVGDASGEAGYGTGHAAAQRRPPTRSLWGRKRDRSTTARQTTCARLQRSRAEPSSPVPGRPRA